MTKLVICLLLLGLFAIHTLGHMNSDPAPGRSPGPPDLQANVQQQQQQLPYLAAGITSTTTESNSKLKQNSNSHSNNSSSRSSGQQGNQVPSYDDDNEFVTLESSNYNLDELDNYRALESEQQTERQLSEEEQLSAATDRSSSSSVELVDEDLPQGTDLFENNRVLAAAANAINDKLHNRQHSSNRTTTAATTTTSRTITSKPTDSTTKQQQQQHQKSCHDELNILLSNTDVIDVAAAETDVVPDVLADEQLFSLTSNGTRQPLQQLKQQINAAAPIKPPAPLINIELQLEHDTFDTSKMNINCGLMYKVRLRTSLRTAAAHNPTPSTPHYTGKFFVESISLASGRERGSFVGHNLGNKLPISWHNIVQQSGTSHSNSRSSSSNNWQSHKMMMTNAIPSDAISSDANDNVVAAAPYTIAENEDGIDEDFDANDTDEDDKNDHNQAADAGEEAQQHRQRQTQFNSKQSDCADNKWHDSLKSQPNRPNNNNNKNNINRYNNNESNNKMQQIASTELFNYWLVNELCERDDTIEFRVFFRATIYNNIVNASGSIDNEQQQQHEQHVYKKYFKFPLNKDCQLQLRATATGTLDYTTLPLYSIDCTVHFPSYQHAQTPEAASNEAHFTYTPSPAPSPAPGILVDLQRLNIPCSSGGYVMFNKHNPLCGKLEELQPADRSYHFSVTQHTSVRLYKTPMFSLSFKLVDYCYNITTSNRSGEFYIKSSMRDTLECYFRIHLPFGNRIQLRVVANNASVILPTNEQIHTSTSYTSAYDVRHAFSIVQENNMPISAQLINLTSSGDADGTPSRSMSNEGYESSSSFGSTTLLQKRSARQTLGNTVPKTDQGSFASKAYKGSLASFAQLAQHQFPKFQNNAAANIQQMTGSNTANCFGVVLKVYENDYAKWSYCINDTQQQQAFILESSSNTLSIHLFKVTPTSYANADDSSLVLPAIYLSYQANAVPAIVSNCAFGWIAMQQFCIAAIELALTWHDAEKYCQGMGGHLASIRNDLQQQIVNNFLFKSPGYQDENAYWVGASDKSYEGDFRWSDGLSFQYTNWFLGWSQHGNYNRQPNDDGLSSQDCIELRRYFRTPPGVQTNRNPLTNTFMWNDRDCNAKNYFICERAMSEDTLRRNWINDCNKTVSLSKEHPRASVWSPSFPRQYPDNANCFTTITAPQGYRIVIEFEELVIENEPGCTYDYLEITEPVHLDALKMAKPSKYRNFNNNYNTHNNINNNKKSNNNNNNVNINSHADFNERENIASIRKNFRKRSSYDYTSFNNPFLTPTTGSPAASASAFDSNYFFTNSFNEINNISPVQLEARPMHLFTNLYKSHTNFLIQTPDYPKGNPYYQSTAKSKSSGDYLPKRLCGDWSTKLKLLRHISTGSYLGLHFVSDYSHHFGGYKAKAYMENRSPTLNAASECGNERLKHYNGSCYLFVSYPEVDWWTAQQVCRGMGSKLTSVASADEHRFITANIRNQIDYSPQLIYWLGAELEKNGHFEWTDDTKMNFQGWLPGHGQFDIMPVDAICLGLQWKMSPTPMLPSGLYWQSQKCSKVGGYVCKKPKESFGNFAFNNLTVTGTEGRLLSPAYPNTYPLNMDYWIHIKSPERTRIIVQFQKIDLESQDECLYDYISIQNYEQVSKITLEPGSNIMPMAMFGSEEYSAIDGDEDPLDMQMEMRRRRRRAVQQREQRRKRTRRRRRRRRRRRSVVSAEQVATKTESTVMPQLMQYKTEMPKQPPRKYGYVNKIEIALSHAADMPHADIDNDKTNNNKFKAKASSSKYHVMPGNRKQLHYASQHDSSTSSRRSKAGQSWNSDGRTGRIANKNSGSDNTMTTNENPKRRRRKKLQHATEIENKLQKYLSTTKNSIKNSSSSVVDRNTESSSRQKRNTHAHMKIIQNADSGSSNALNGNTGVYPTVTTIQTSTDTTTNPKSHQHNTEDNAQTFLPYVRWCGAHDSNMSKFDFVSSSNQVMLNFHSDYSVTGLGFSATWKAIDISGCPLQTLTSREGKVFSPNFPHFLLNNLQCVYVIQAPIGRRVWLEFTEFDLQSDAVLEVDIGNGFFRPFRLAYHLNEGIFVSLREQLRVQFRTGQHPRGRGFFGIYHTVGQMERRERVINLSKNATGHLYQLNYPHNQPENVDFTQHLVAPFGDNILLELHGVEFSENGCADNNMLEIYDNYADYNGTKWQLCTIPNLPMDVGNSNNNIRAKQYIGNEQQRADSMLLAFSNAISHQQQQQEEEEHFTSIMNTPPVYITSYLNTLHIRQRTTAKTIANLNATIRIQWDNNYKMKLTKERAVESCQPNPCQFNGKCIVNNGTSFCQCHGHYTGRFCGLTLCEQEPCVFGKCELTLNNFKCQCQPGYMGLTCEQKQRPCADNPCEGRGICFEKNGGFHCRCHAWWEGNRCERRMLHIPYKPLSERMLQEPFWLGLITVFVVLAVIGLVWCAKRHFPEKIEKLLAEEADRNRPPGSIHGHHHHTSLREQLQFTTAIPQSTMNNAPGAPRSIFNRLGIRKPSILSLSSPNPISGGGAAASRTFSLDDLLRPPPRRSPSPRKKRNNSTPVKKNAAEKKQILQQLVSPAPTQTKPKVSLGELIQMSENRLRASTTLDSETELKETTFSECSGATSLVTATVERTMVDPKLEKKVTFARLLNKVSAEMSSGSEVEIGHMAAARNSSALSLPTDIQLRASSMPPSPCTNDIRSPHSTSSNHGSDSLSSSDLILTDFGLRSMQTSGSDIGSTGNQIGASFTIGGVPTSRHRFGSTHHQRPKVSSADSILAMFRNFASTATNASNFSGTTLTTNTSVFVSPSTTPTMSSPQDDLAGDDESSTSSMHTPVSFSSGAPDSPIFYRQTTIEVPVLDVLNAHKSSSPSSSSASSGSNLLHPPTILLEIPSNGINKCLSPIREMPTPIPSPALTPIMPRQRSNSPIFQEDPLSGGDYSEEDEDERSEREAQLSERIRLGLQRDRTPRHMDTDIETTPTETTTTSTADMGRQHQQQYRMSSSHQLPTLCLPNRQTSTSSTTTRRTNVLLTPPTIMIDVEPPTPEEKQQRPRDLIIPTLTVEQPSPTKNRHPMIIFPGSPPPQRASIGETSFMFPNKQQQKRLLKHYEKPTSLDYPFVPPMITVTSNMSELESDDTEPMSPATKAAGAGGLMPPNPVGMCYLSPFTMCGRGDRTISESNLSSSGYSSMASPGPSRCGSSNPLYPHEMDEPGSGHSGHGFSLHVNLMNRRKSTALASCKENVTNGKSPTSGGDTTNNNGGGGGGGTTEQIHLHRPRSDSETFSDDILIESNDEGIGTDHVDEKLDMGRFKELDMFLEDEVLIEVEEPCTTQVTSSTMLSLNAIATAAMGNTMTTTTPMSTASGGGSNQMAQLQLPSIVIQMDGCSEKGHSPVSSRSESPLSERCGGIGRFSPHFYGRKDQLPFTDSDGLYDFPSSDGKGTSAQSYTHQRRSSSKKRERKSSKCHAAAQAASAASQSPIKQQQLQQHLDIPSSKDTNNSTTLATSGSGSGSYAATQSNTPPHHVCNKHCHSHHHPCPASTVTTRKSPKRRVMSRLPIASSSSSSESLTSTKELSVRPLPRRLNSPNREKRPRKQESLSEDEVADALLRRISPSLVKEDSESAKPKCKINRLRAIGNQIRFLRRLEKSIKTRERIASPTDSCPEENTDDMEDSPQATSPLLQPTEPSKTKLALCRQKRLPSGTYGLTTAALQTQSWRGMDCSLMADDLNSD